MSANPEIANPEIAKTIEAAGFATNYHDQGQGDPVMLIHGSGAGVTAWANWRLAIPELARRFRVVAPDMLGFGYSARPAGLTYSKDVWLRHAVGFLDAMKLDKVDLVGNSFGGGLALALAIRHPDRVRRLVLMGAVGLSFPLTKGLDMAWGYTPSLDNMRKLLDVFAYDRAMMTEDLARMRYEASIRPGFQESFAAMFPAPRQAGVDMLASAEADIAKIQHETLILHGREDQVIPLDVSLRLASLIDRSQLHVFGRCGHWTQIEHAARFNRLVGDFFAEGQNANA